MYQNPTEVFDKNKIIQIPAFKNREENLIRTTLIRLRDLGFIEEVEHGTAGIPGKFQAFPQA
jgi:hypothetical protein